MSNARSAVPVVCIGTIGAGIGAACVSIVKHIQLIPVLPKLCSDNAQEVVDATCRIDALGNHSVALMSAAMLLGGTLTLGLTYHNKVWTGVANFGMWAATKWRGDPANVSPQRPDYLERDPEDYQAESKPLIANR